MTRQARIKSVLRAIYHDVAHPAGFGGRQALFDAARDHVSDLTLEDVDEWLRGETVYTLHRHARHKFPRNKTISHSVGEWCQADLADMQSYATSNDGFKYLLTFIDVFSKRATAVPIKSKNMTHVSEALDSILADFHCHNLLTDRGLEFNNTRVKDVMSKYGTRLCFAHNEAIKAAVVERFNRTLKTRMHRYFTSKGTRRYIDVLESLLLAYNQSVHSSTGLKPVDVDSHSASDVFRKLYGAETHRQLLLKEPKDKALFRVGDLVRIRYVLTPMQKSYWPMFSDQVYTVSTVVPDFPYHMYRVENWKGETMNRKYYAHDLLRVSKDVKYRVEKVLKRRGNMSFVKWVGYPSEANSWVRGLVNV